MIRFYLGAAFSVGCGAIMLISILRGQPIGQAGDPPEQPSTVESDWVRIEQVEPGALVLRATEQAAAGWRAGKLDEAAVNSASAVTHALMRSVLSADFEPYKRMTEEVGLIFNDKMATEVLRQYRAWDLYSELDTLEERGLDTLDLFQYAWEHPAPRAMDIVSLSIDSITAGVGLQVDGSQWPYPGWQAQFTVFHRDAGELTIDEGEEIERTGRSAFIVFAVGLADGRRGHIRLTMFEDPVSKRWLPLNLVTGVELGESNRAMIPML